MEQLTKRETEVASLIKAGKTTREIAGVLSISPRTVEIHRCNIILKLGLRRYRAVQKEMFIQSLNNVFCDKNTLDTH